MSNERTGKWIALGVIVVVVLVANAPLLDRFLDLLQRDGLAVSATDAPTHYFRMLATRDRYLPSGHHLGWEPFWFQGYVPFLLYPHLTYVLMALASWAIPVDPGRVFNAYTLAIYLGLPVLAGWLLAQSSGLLAGVVAAAWFSVVSAVGAGLNSVFVIGLLTQQAGMVVFVALSHDLMVTRRIDRAAIWLGLAALVHVHTALAAGALWLVALAVRAFEASSWRVAAREWVTASLYALCIASPTILALIQGRHQVGMSLAYEPVSGIFWKILGGGLLAPRPTLLAMVLCLGVALASTDRRRVGPWVATSLLLVAVSVAKWDTGWPLFDRLLNSILYLRTLSFAFACIAVLAASTWPGLPRIARAAVLSLTAAGVLFALPPEASLHRRIGTAWQGHGREEVEGVQAFHRVLGSIARDSRERVATIALVAPPKPVALYFATAVERSGLPVLGGHGAELTNIRNVALADQTLDLSCDRIRNQIRNYAVGYLVGFSRAGKDHLARCLGSLPAYGSGDWWAFATGASWADLSPSSDGFLHDPTWTHLEWRFRDLPAPLRARLPIANSAPWAADIDGATTGIESTPDGMMTLTVPPGARSLRLNYLGYPGEWASVLLSASALLASAVRIRRRRRSPGARTPSEAGTESAAERAPTVATK